jgi:hypothetical protein
MGLAGVVRAMVMARKPAVARDNKDNHNDGDGSNNDNNHDDNGVKDSDKDDYADNDDEDKGPQEKMPFFQIAPGQFLSS